MDDRRDADRRRDPDGPEGSSAAPSRRVDPIAPTGAPAVPPTSEQLRDDIDNGRTHDKVANSDPAAVPLGADAEAGGAPPTPEQVSTARRHEATRGVPEQPSASRAASQTTKRPNMTIIWAVIAVVVIAIILALMF